MMTSTAPCKIDSVEIGEISINFFEKQVTGTEAGVMSAKYALVVSSEGARRGSGNRNVWSEPTLQKLRELITLMESDICLDLFGDTHTARSVEQGPDDTADSVPSL